MNCGFPLSPLINNKKTYVCKMRSAHQISNIWIINLYEIINRISTTTTVDDNHTTTITHQQH